MSILGAILAWKNIRYELSFYKYTSVLFEKDLDESILSDFNIKLSKEICDHPNLKCTPNYYNKETIDPFHVSVPFLHSENVKRGFLTFQGV